MSEEQQVQPQLALERIYSKDISFEISGAQVFTKVWEPPRPASAGRYKARPDLAAAAQRRRSTARSMRISFPGKTA